MLTPPLQFDGRLSVIGLEETNQTSGTITFDEIGSAFEITTPHEPYGDFETAAYVMNEDTARLMASAPHLLTALTNLLDWCREHTSPVQPNSPHELLVAAHNAITKATGDIP